VFRDLTTVNKRVLATANSSIKDGLQIGKGADFYRAMVATAPGEKLLTGRRPVRNWTRRMISSLF